MWFKFLNTYILVLRAHCASYPTKPEHEIQEKAGDRLNDQPSFQASLSFTPKMVVSGNSILGFKHLRTLVACRK